MAIVADILLIFRFVYLTIPGLFVGTGAIQLQ